MKFPCSSFVEIWHICPWYSQRFYVLQSVFFPSDDLAISLKDLDLESDDKSLQLSLGLNWYLNSDNFLFRLSPDNKPVTRGILDVSMSFTGFFQISHSVAIPSDTGSSQSSLGH
jgi:hypothetical protein